MRFTDDQLEHFAREVYFDIRFEYERKQSESPDSRVDEAEANRVDMAAALVTRFGRLHRAEAERERDNV